MLRNKQNPVTYYVLLTVYMVLACLLRLVMLAPLACLFLKSDLPGLKWGALLCPVLLILVVLPLRFSFARAMVPLRKGERRFRLAKAFSFEDYGEKLAQSLCHALHVLKWGIPLFGLCAYGWYVKDAVDVKTLLNSLVATGTWGSSLWYGLLNGLRGLLGQEALVQPANHLMDGVFVVLAVVVLAAVLWLYGAVRNSATRYVWVQTDAQDRKLYPEVRRRLRGRRLAQLVVALTNLILCLPFWIMVYVQLKPTLISLASALPVVALTGKLPAVNLQEALLPMVWIWVGLYLPLLPARRWLTSRFAIREQSPKA